MPLANNQKISLLHKKNNVIDKAPFEITTQEVPESIFLPASLTVEAALVFPMFLFALVTVLFFFRLQQVTQITAGALAATGSRLSMEADAENGSLLPAVGYFQKELMKEEFPEEMLAGGRMGIDWNGSHLEGEYLELQIRYSCRLPVRVFGLTSIPICQRVRMKKWTGCHGGEGEGSEEQAVYITPNGTVYHLSVNCTHLKLSTGIMDREAAKKAGYTACLLCGNAPGLYPYYYVTEEGRKYHTRLDCSGLKRTVYAVRLSEVGNREVCSRCGGVQ